VLPRLDRAHDQFLTGYHGRVVRARAVRAESVWAALGGIFAGYLLWLTAFSIGDWLTAVGLWGPAVLVASLIFAVGAMLWGRRLRGRGNGTLAAFASGLPVLPVLLSVAVVVDSYL
jgi:hypothetical protein